MTVRALRLCLALLGLLGGPALAQDGDVVDPQQAGTVDMMLGERALSLFTSSSVYDTVRIGSVSISPVNPDDTGPDAKMLLSIMANANPDGTGAMVTLMVEYIRNPGEDGVVTMADFTEEAGAVPFWSAGAAGRQPMTLTVESFEFDGTVGRITGAFAGELCKTADWGQAPDPADCQTVSGRLDSAVYQGL